MENEQKNESQDGGESPDAPLASPKESAPRPGRIKPYYIFFAVIALTAVAGLVLPLIVGGAQTKIQTLLVYALIPFLAWAIYASRKRGGEEAD